MELIELLEALRDNYTTAYYRTYRSQVSLGADIYPEIAFELSGGVYQNLYVVDLLKKNGGTSDVIEVASPEDSYLEGGVYEFGSMKVEVGLVSWEAMRFDMLPSPDGALVGFDEWFRNWMNVDEVISSDSDHFGQMIHSVAVKNGQYDIDFGSATPEAFLEFLEVLQSNGVRLVRVTSGRS